MVVFLSEGLSCAAHAESQAVIAKSEKENENADAVSALRKPTVSLWRNIHSVRLTEIPSKYRK